VQHIIRNNLISTCTDCVFFFSGGGSSATSYNNIYDPSSYVLRYCTGLDQYGQCISFGTSYTSSNLASSFGQNHKSVSTSFSNVSGSIPTWNLHLLSTDTVNKDAGITTSLPPTPINDIDLQSRTGGNDLGADEISGGSSVTPTPTPTATAMPTLAPTSMPT